MHEQLVQQIDDLLPQTQCTQCGFEGCLPYAKALARQEADLNRCPPGGETTIAALSALLNLPRKPVDPDCGTTIERHIASINPQHCIGCTLCIKACPVDAIVGSSKRRHAVLAELCTGCELCIPPCPVDCIDMVFMPEFSDWDQTQAHAARARMQLRETRLMRQKQEQAERLEAKAIHKLDELDDTPSPDAAAKKAVVQAALARARARRQAQTP
ncbi:RnfABCDGE type electron transport complex subunit B [Limnobacter alexandrii]|jgi:Na+-translocating ferredoxin:NAD+ oxidoreductase subunit B|uniref:RnfABCDGE type electron transport complex subunit B n=1 Tax=Limnobacter alexandrii TaxID=2570352 RepID=UPI00110999A2|nr:RnfABCDGE type electron transport complex subunit B [Limnobacter alexandrii]